MSARMPRALAGLAAVGVLACADVDPLPQPNTGIPINPASLTLYVGDSAAVGFTVEQGTRIAVTSSAPAIAELSSADATPARSVMVYGKAAGTAALVVTFSAGQEVITGSVPVTVMARPNIPAAIGVSPNLRVMAVGDTARFTPWVLTSRPAEDTGVTFVSRDTTIVAVDSTGLATAKREGVASIALARRSDPRLIAIATVTVVPGRYSGARLVVSPAEAITLQPNASLVIAAALVRGDSVLTRDPLDFDFRSSDSCVAYVTPEGRLFGGRHGQATIGVSARGLPDRVASIATTVRAPAALRVTIQSLTTGTPAAPVDPSAVRGTVTVNANVDASLLPAGLELALGGRLVEARDVPAPSGGGLVPLAFVVNTAARDTVDGSPLFANGFQYLTLTVAPRRRPPVPGCPEELDRQTLRLAVTLANPAPAAGRAP